MEEKKTSLENICDFREVQPIMMDLPYPETRVRKQNQTYANLISIDYCGSVSELSAITQYINHENILSCDNCPIAKTLLGIAMAEMIHLQKLGELIFLLGGKIDFLSRYRDGNEKMWTPQYVKMSNNPREMIRLNVKGERDAIEQYRMHMRMINDDYVRAVLARIIRDEEYHIMMLQTIIKDL